MDSLTDRISSLSPEKKALLQLKLRQHQSASTPPDHDIPQRPPGMPAPLSFAQQRLWFLDQLEPESSFYNIHRGFRLEGALDVETLRKSLNAIVDRHEALRTRIDVGDGAPFQLTVENRQEVLTIIELNLSDVPAGERQDRLQRSLQSEVRRPFKLSRDLMLRAALVRIGPAEHVLLLVTHHIASDGWSNEIITQELAGLYMAFLLSEPNPFSALPIRYSDYAVWQRHWLSGKILEDQLSYWKNQLSGISVLQLPTDRPRPAIQTYNGAAQSLVISRALKDQLHTLSRAEGVTLFMTLLATFQVLLHRYSTQDDITVGSPIAGRTRPETEGVVGMFVNTLVFRTDLSGSPGFREILHRVRRVALGAFEHQDVPFEKLVEELRPDRDLSRSPLFQVMFAYQNIPRQPFQLPGLTVSDIPASIDTTAFDLSLYLTDSIEGLAARLEYNSDLFDSATARRMLGHFETLLASAVSNPNLPVSDLRLVSEAETHQLLVGWNNTKANLPAASFVHELFEAQVERSPMAVAVEFEGSQLSYRELNTKANQLAHCLRKMGVGPNVLVGICMERSLDMLVGLLGILKAGGAYVPLDPAYPKERQAFVLQDTQVAVVVTQKVLLPMPDGNVPVLCLDRDWKDISQYQIENPDGEGGPDNLANVIYTSGSTGLPKGVRIPHGALMNLLNAVQKQLALCDRDRLLAVTTLAFDIAGLELFLPLLSGSRVVLASREVAADGTQLMRRISDSGATVMQATPATWRILLESGWQGSIDLKILCGGETLPRELARSLVARSSSVWNMYGPTETTIWSTMHRVSADADVISIGRPIDNTQIYILDAQLQPRPIGLAGELYIGGLGMARGYLNRPELTSERFIPNPFRSEPGARLYKTGDLARYRANGDIEILGRIDQQIKIRGFRVEPGEIEAVLALRLDTQQSIVIAREDSSGEKQLVAYVVPKPQHRPTVHELMEFLKTRLPDYMVPSAFVFLDALPMTPNGKVDRKALPVPDMARAAPEGGFVAARDHIQREIGHIWEKVLRVQPVGIRDNFFDLGGHSLLAVRVIGQIEKAFGKRLPVTAIFQLPTVEQLAQLLRQEVHLAPWSSLTPLQPKGSKSPFFWIHGETSDAFLHRYLGPDQPLYGLLHQAHDGKPALYTSVEDIAAHYLSEIQTVQPHGPYFLGGYCFGGMLAFEIAHQLNRRGEQVALLVLLDPSSPRTGDPLGQSAEKSEKSSGNQILRRELPRHVQNARTLGPRKGRAYVAERVKDRVRGWTLMLTKPFTERIADASCRLYLRFGRPIPPSLRSRYILKVYFKAIREYVPKVYPGRLVIFREAKKWTALAAEGAEIYDVPGSHTNILEEANVRLWAESLKTHLQAAQSRISAETTRSASH